MYYKGTVEEQDKKIQQKIKIQRLVAFNNSQCSIVFSIISCKDNNICYISITYFNVTKYLGYTKNFFVYILKYNSKCSNYCYPPIPPNKITFVIELSRVLKCSKLFFAWSCCAEHQPILHIFHTLKKWVIYYFLHLTTHMIYDIHRSLPTDPPICFIFF